MYLYIFLNVIIICITIIICFILSNFTEISDYREYKNDHLELKRLRDEYNETITKYQTQVENICDKIDKLKIFDKEYTRRNDKIISLLFDIKKILHDNVEDHKKIEAIKTAINMFCV